LHSQAKRHDALSVQTIDLYHPALMRKHLETQKFLDHKQYTGMQKSSGKKIALFTTILHFIALYQDFSFWQPLYSVFFNEINDLEAIWRIFLDYLL
jgi:hypothetical protein